METSNDFSSDLVSIVDNVNYLKQLISFQVLIQHKYYQEVRQEVIISWDITICAATYTFLNLITIKHSIIAFYTTISITAKCSYL